MFYTYSDAFSETFVNCLAKAFKMFVSHKYMANIYAKHLANTYKRVNICEK